MDGPRPPPVQLVPGQQPTPEQMAAIRAHMQEDAERLGLTMEQYVQRLREAHEQQQAAAQAQQGGHVHGPNCNHDHDQGPRTGHQQVRPGPPKPEAIALAAFLKGQDLKIRTCVFQDQRKDMFRVKRAIRALQSPAYQKARSKKPILPQVTDRPSAEAAFKLLPLSFLALRVEKMDSDEAHEGHSHGKKKRVKGLWDVQVIPQQDAEDDMYYMWLYEGAQWKQKAYAVGALVVVMCLVMFPLWPLVLRQGAWYLSMGFFGLIVLFFVMAIFRLILFLITMFTHAPGLWLFPNLFEDVGFVESFIPLWAWQVDAKSARKAKRLEKEQKLAAKSGKVNGTHVTTNGSGPAAAPTATAAAPAVSTTGNDAKPAPTGTVSQRRVLQASVEEAEDD